MDTITKYDKTRVEFDAYRTRMEEVQMTPKYDMSGQKLRAAQIEMDKARAEYEKKRHDVSVKLELLDENRIKVMRQQLVLLHSATGMVEKEIPYYCVRNSVQTISSLKTYKSCLF